MKILRIAMIALITAVVSALLLWLCGWFISLEPNVLLWEKTSRYVYLILILAVVIPTVVSTIMKEEGLGNG